MIILNLTQHAATSEQLAQGVFELLPEDREAVKGLLTFEEIPSCGEMWKRAIRICGIVDSYMPDEGIEVYSAMIGGAPFFMGVLERTLFQECGIAAKYSFSKRVSIESNGPNGEVVKTSSFSHIGFVNADV